MTLDSFVEKCANAGFTIPDNEDWRELYECLTCGDTRYEGHTDAIILDVFMKNEAVIREDITLTVPMPIISELKGYYGKGDVQVKEKAILSAILAARGFTIEGYELQCKSGEADLIAHNKDGLTVIGEVGACRVSKVLESLLTPPYTETLENIELWHLPYPEIMDVRSGYQVDCKLYVYKRGKNWNELQRAYKAAVINSFNRGRPRT
jgi:hypothetical protein